MSEDRNPMAFPRPSTDHGSYGSPGQDGMTLRDYFAAAALGALRLDRAFVERASGMSLLPEEHAAKICFAVADAMLAARQEPTS